jgi:hypothetical protein
MFVGSFDEPAALDVAPARTRDQVRGVHRAPAVLGGPRGAGPMGPNRQSPGGAPFKSVCEAGTPRGPGRMGPDQLCPGGAPPARPCVSLHPHDSPGGWDPIDCTWGRRLSSSPSARVGGRDPGHCV